MDLDALRQARKLLFELVPSRDFERHQGNLPGSGGGPQGLFEPTDVEHEYASGAQLRGPADRHGAHQAPVEKVLARDVDRWQKAWDGTRGEHGVGHRPGRKPMGRRPFYGGGHAFEPNGEISKARAGAQSLVE
jgi:hypothetical protein